jgi:hypothetical protein
MNCPDLCTKAKCEELENKITELDNRLTEVEEIIEQLKDIQIDGKLSGEFLELEVKNFFVTDNVDIDLTDFCTDERLDDHIDTKVNVDSSLSHEYEPNFLLSAKLFENPNDFLLNISLTLEGENKFQLVTWDKHKPDFEQVFVDVTEPNGGQQEIFVSVKIDGIVKSDTALLSTGSGNNPINIGGSYQNDILTLTVATDTDTDSDTILIPLQQDINNLENTINNIINNTMDCDLSPVLTALENCCQTLITENNENQALLDALYFLIELRTGQLETISNDILEKVTLTIRGTNYTVDCESVDENGNITPIETEIEGATFQGLADLITELNKQVCQTNLTLCQSNDEQDVVAIVASERDLTRIQGKQLILHFVTLDNYPTRASNSNYRPIQIPSPRDEYDWEQDFEDLRWQQGNCYCELQLKTSQNILVKPSVSGFFENKNKADEFFDRVLELTTLSEANRKYHEFDVPKRNIPTRETRPYRAFITSVNDEGKAICETKYLPPIEPEN